MAKASKVDYGPKYTKKLSEFICDKIEEGLTVAEVCKKYPGDVPIEKTMYRWQKKYPEFKTAVRDAYKTLLMRLVDEKLFLANRAIALSAIINKTKNETLTDEDGVVTTLKTVDDAIKKAKFELDAIKIKQRALEFTLTRIAPKFVEDLRETPLQNQVANLPPINIVYYRPKELDEKKD